MTPEQADALAMHIAKVWPDERPDPWALVLADLDHQHTVVTLTECRRLYTGPKLHPVSFRTAYGPTWPGTEPALATCDLCSSTGVTDIHPDTGQEQFCDCGHGQHRRRLTAPADPVSSGRFLTDDERTRGLARIATLRAQLADRTPR